MDDNRLLFDAFEIYYDRGIAALQKNEYPVARRNILAAAETLLKIAKDSTGAVKAQRLKRANELYDLANKIEQKQKVATDTSNTNSVARDAAKFGVGPSGGSGSGNCTAFFRDRFVTVCCSSAACTAGDDACVHA